MRKNLLALSIAAMIGGLTGAANATVIANTAATGLNGTNAPVAATRLTPTNTGVGHILLVPYFSTQGSNVSLLNIVNTDEVNGKAVKLRYRGASNSDDIFDITVYLSPSDMWTASVVVDAAGVSSLVTSDTSCTLPSKQDIKDNGGKFQLGRVRGAAAAQTREGYIEILNTADIPPTLVDVNGVRTPTANALFGAIKHAAGTPTCAGAVMDLQENPLTDTGANAWFTRGYTFPTGLLMANWTVANIAKKSVTTGEAVAVKATPDAVIDVPGAANIVWFPQTTAVVPTATAATWSADPLLANGSIKAAMYDFPDLSTPYTGGGTPSEYANNLAAMIQTTSVVNEFVTTGSATAGTDFATDWVFSMPTRRYAVGVNYAGSGSLVFNSAVNSHFTSANVSYDATKGQACIDSSGLRAWDREETTRSTFVISPSTALRFCGEVSVLSFNNKASVLGAELAAIGIDTKFSEGWMRINTAGANGLNMPVIGYSAVGYAGGALGGTWMHRTNRR